MAAMAKGARAGALGLEKGIKGGVSSCTCGVWMRIGSFALVCTDLQEGTMIGEPRLVSVVIISYETQISMRARGPATRCYLGKVRGVDLHLEGALHVWPLSNQTAKQRRVVSSFRKLDAASLPVRKVQGGGAERAASAEAQRPARQMCTWVADEERQSTLPKLSDRSLRLNPLQYFFGSMGSGKK